MNDAPVRICVDMLAWEGGSDGSICLEYSAGSFRGFREEPGRGGIDLRGSNSIAIPGVLDLHVHLRGLRLSYKEDELSGSRAAASGCVAAVADMPNTKPELRHPDALAAKLRALESRSVVDYAVYAGIPLKPSLSRRLASMGAVGFKVYPEDLSLREGLCSALETAEALGLIVVLHPEDPSMFNVEWGFYRHLSRPCEAEVLAVARLWELMGECGAWPKVHVTHASCPGTVDESKRRGFTVDSTPHHLFMDSSIEDLWGPCMAKVNPPLRSPLESHRLRSMLAEGMIDALASDHAPHAAWEKLGGHPAYCSPGFPWLEWWVGFTTRRLLSSLGPARLSELLSKNPRSILGARLKPLDSLSVLSLESSRVYWKGFSRARLTPAMGMEAYECLATVASGRLVYLSSRGVLGGGGGGRRIAP